MRHEHIDLIMEELERYGFRGQVGERGKHLEVRWNLPVGERFVIVPKTPSDWRGGMNSRSDLRKILRADGLQPKPINELSFQKAMTVPRPVTITKELVVQQDVNALTDLVFEQQATINSLQEQITLLHDKFNSVTVVSRIEFAGQKQSEDADTVLQVSRKVYQEVKAPRIKKTPKREQILALLSFEYRPRTWIMEQGVKTIDTTKASINQCLAKAKRDGIVESGLRGMWRLKKHD